MFCTWFSSSGKGVFPIHYIGQTTIIRVSSIPKIPKPVIRPYRNVMEIRDFQGIWLYTPFLSSVNCGSTEDWRFCCCSEEKRHEGEDSTVLIKICLGNTYAGYICF